jgi:two-component system, sensor histidine kinase and response regulator
MTTILVIEDEQTIRENIVETLELYNFKVLGASNGTEGIQLARKYLPDLIICDIMMPELNGYVVLLDLRNEPATAAIPFMFLTAKADRTAVRQGMDLGADDYLTKPFTTAELIAAVHARLKRHDTPQVSAERLERAKAEFTRMVTHELRTPLSSITTVQDIITRQLGQLSRHELAQLLETLGSGSRRLAHVVEQMVMITQLDTDVVSRRSVIDMGVSMQTWQILAGAVNLARHFAYRRPDVTIRLDERDREAEIKCIALPLKHAIAELIVNALNFSPEGSEVAISQWQADNSVWISIMDGGSGIPTEQLELVLEDFRQLDREVREQQGMGLGLPLARRIIELHGGRLKLKSVVNKGTQVAVELPRLVVS